MENSDQQKGSDSNKSLHLSVLFEPKRNDISTTPTVKSYSPRAKSTPTTQTEKRVIRLDLDTIPEGSNEISEAKLNFSQPADTTEIPLLIVPPFPPLNHFPPLNQFTNVETETTFTEASGQLPSPPALKNNVMSSRQCLTYKAENWVHFISRDCKHLESLGRFLIDIEAINIDALKREKAQVGQIIRTPKGKQNIYSLVL